MGVMPLRRQYAISRSASRIPAPAAMARAVRWLSSARSTSSPAEAEYTASADPKHSIRCAAPFAPSIGTNDMAMSCIVILYIYTYPLSGSACHLPPVSLYLSSCAAGRIQFCGRLYTSALRPMSFGGCRHASHIPSCMFCGLRPGCLVTLCHSTVCGLFI